MTDNFIEKAQAVVDNIRKCIIMAANDEDDFNLFLLSREVSKIEPKAIFKFKKKRLLIKIL